MKDITSVGALLEQLRAAEPEEPLSFQLEEEGPDGSVRRSRLRCVGVGSSGGGRAVVVWLSRPPPAAPDYVI